MATNSIKVKGEMMSNNIHEVHFDTVLMNLKSTSAKGIYKKLSKHVSNLIGTPEKFLLDAIMKNEENKNSGTENGVAIVHARLPRLTRPIIIYSKIVNLIEPNLPI